MGMLLRYHRDADFPEPNEEAVEPTPEPEVPAEDTDKKKKKKD
jgi:hypothetical protein